MYNSKPRYNSFSSDYNVPENYSGNAFFEEHLEEGTNEAEQNIKEEERREVEVSALPEKKKAGFHIDVSRLFGGGIGFEELLILGLVLLMAGGEGNEDMIILLLLLLFIG